MRSSAQAQLEHAERLAQLCLDAGRAMQPMLALEFETQDRRGGGGAAEALEAARIRR